jgi:PIN domain nuclease of toxin-antitoxin system
MTILLDTHVWIWWSIDSPRLSEGHRQATAAGEPDGIAVSGFSVWEVAMLASKNRIDLGGPAQVWLDRVLAVPPLHVLPVTPQLLLDSTVLPATFHADPADRIIVATARTYGLTLLTADRDILDYPHVNTLAPT